MKNMFGKEDEMEIRVKDIDQKYQEFRCSCGEIVRSRFNFPQNNIVSLIQKVKRERLECGPYKGVSFFEAINRIASDIVLWQGLAWLIKHDFIGEKNVVHACFGNINDNGEGDIKITDGNTSISCEVFNVAPSFFSVKLQKTLKKWRNAESRLHFIFCNGDVVGTYQGRTRVQVFEESGELDQDKTLLVPVPVELNAELFKKN